jgi:hypothetical protein
MKISHIKLIHTGMKLLRYFGLDESEGVLVVNIDDYIAEIKD